MAESPYLYVRIMGEELEVPQVEDFPITVSYEIEDESDFQQKKSGTAFNITVPATPANSRKLGTVYHSGAEDTLPGDGLKQAHNVALIGAGHEFMTGKGFILNGVSKEGKAESFDINIFGDNADWTIPLKETTLQECLSGTTHIFSKATIEASWNHDGTVENEDFVYAPFRAREAFGLWQGNDIPDDIFRPDNARPALFIYWILWRGLKLAGYKIQSNFADTEYFRRSVMPWTWGNFFYVTDKLLKEMGFLATTPLTSGGVSNPGVTGTPFSWTFRSLTGTGSSTVNDVAKYDSGNTSEDNFIIDNVTTDIGYIGLPGSYSYNPTTGEMSWEYLTVWGALGLLTVGFQLRLSVSIDLSFDSNANVDIEVLVNGTIVQSFGAVFSANAPTLGTDEDFGTRDTFIQVPNLAPGDIVTFRIPYHCFKSTFGFCFLKIYGGGDGLQLDPTPAGAPTEDVRSFLKLTYIRRQLGSVIDFKEYDKFKNYKFLDLFRGVIDAFNLQIDTDPISKTVFFEPTHSYSLTNDLGAASNPGYYTGDAVDWSQKKDISIQSSINIFQDYEREVTVQLQNDVNDGILKLLQDRHQSNLTLSKYVFPPNFKKGAKKIENRFFSGVTHYNHDRWKSIRGVSPQMICLIPENISNTSNPESETTFSPKLAYYAGMKDANIYGGWNWDGSTTIDFFPYMFAVDYKPGGEQNPVFTYGDQRIDDGAGGWKLAKGWFKRFFAQRFAIMRHGKKESSNFHLVNEDVINNRHREFKIIGENRYQLIKISQYKPLLDKSTTCVLWRWWPVTNKDEESTFPSQDSVLTGVQLSGVPDEKYAQMLALFVDIPQ